MARIYATCLAVLLALTAAGCGQPEPENTATASPSVSSSPASPSPAAAPTPDEVTPTVEVVTEDVLSRFSGYSEFVEFDEDGYQKIVITVNGAVTDFKWIEVAAQDDGAGGITYETAELYALDELTPDKPFVVTWMEWGLLPHRGISFTDADGTVRRFYVVADATGESETPLRFIEF
jgi:hypothetical protein